MDFYFYLRLWFYQQKKYVVTQKGNSHYLFIQLSKPMETRKLIEGTSFFI